jgi:hypothetical protein
MTLPLLKVEFEEFPITSSDTKVPAIQNDSLVVGDASPLLDAGR